MTQQEPILQCPACSGEHHIQSCPSIRAALFAPQTYRCNDCGDPINFDGVCLDCCRFVSDDRISIGLPVKQDNGENEYPGFIDGRLINFYRTRHHADLALRNILAREMPAAFGHEVLDLDFDSALVWAGA